MATTRPAHRLTLATLVALACATPAEAATVVSRQVPTMVQIAGDADGDELSLSTAGGEIQVTPNQTEAARISAGIGCTKVTEQGVTFVRCPVEQFNVTATLGGGSDRFTIAAPFPGRPQFNVTVDGGDGADRLIASRGFQERAAERLVMRGGAGNDTLGSGPGSDQLDGGAGVDTITYEDRTAGVTVLDKGTGDSGEAGEHDQLLNFENATTGDGDDLIDFGTQPDPAVLNGGAGKDVITGGTAADNIRGGRGDDTLAGGEGDDIIRGELNADVIDGGPGADLLYGKDGTGNRDEFGRSTETTPGDTIDLDTVRGGSGADLIDAGPGSDSVRGDTGADVISARDGYFDSISCGEDKGEFWPNSVNDQASLDLMDKRPADCEEFVFLAIPKREGPPQRLSARVRRKRVLVTLRCPKGLDHGCRGRLVTTSRTAKGKVVSRIGAARYRVRAGRRARFGFALPPKARRRFVFAESIEKGDFGEKRAGVTAR